MAYLQSLDCICQLESYISHFVVIILFSSNFGKLKKKKKEEEEDLWIRISCCIPNVVSIYLAKFIDEK